MRLGTSLTLVVLALGLTVTSAQAEPHPHREWQRHPDRGPTGVNVGGTLYDVEFVDGTCVALFTGCDQPSDFTFTTAADADVASQALLDQVLLDTGVGAFDSNPALTFGCSNSIICFVDTPYHVLFLVDFRSAVNYPSGPDGLGGLNWPATGDTTDLTLDVIARWTPSADVAPVPEPASLTLRPRPRPRRHGRTALAAAEGVSAS